MDDFEHSGVDQHWLIGAQQILIEELQAELVRLRAELAQAHQLIEIFSSVPADDEVISPLPTTFDTLSDR
ncbi:MAG: hypothetical protein AAGF95_18020 [Chloroflexota bacterium]